MDVVLAQVFQGISSAALTWYRDRTGTAKKLDRLDMLVTELYATVEVSENSEIIKPGSHLQKLQQKFKDAAIQGDEVHQQLQGQLNNINTSSGIIAFFEGFFSRKVHEEKLNSTLELLEQICARSLDRFQKNLKLELQSENRRLKLKRSADSLKTDEEARKERRKAKWEEEEEESVNAISLVDDEYCFDSLVIVDDEYCFKVKAEGAPAKRQLQFKRLLLARNLDHEVAAVEGLAADIWHAIESAKHKRDDGSWFGRWIAKLREAVKEGNSVAATIKSNINFCDVDDQILDEVGVIVTAVRQRLESMVSDLKYFTNLAKAEELARMIGTPAGGPSNACA